MINIIAYWLIVEKFDHHHPNHHHHHHHHHNPSPNHNNNFVHTVVKRLFWTQYTMDLFVPSVDSSIGLTQSQSPRKRVHCF